MSNTSNRPSDLGSNDLEEDYPCIHGISGGTRNLSHAYSPEHQLCTGREGYSVQSRYINSNFHGNEDIGPQPHPYEGYKLEFKRLETYNDWPSNAPVKAKDLARNGFIYLHVKDRVQCAFCRGILSSWEEGDVIEQEHKKHCPECPFAFGYECGNVPLNQPRNGQINIPVLRHSPVQFQTSQGHQLQSQHGNFSYSGSQLLPQSLPKQTNSHISGVPNSSRPNVAPQQIPHPQRTTQTIQVRPETNADLSYNRQTGSLNIYGVTIRAGNQEDAWPMPTLPPQTVTKTINNETVITAPKYPKWDNEQVRLKSFAGWPSQIQQKPSDLAKAGLLYMGSGDRVKCFWCGGELHDWEPEDVPMEEHAKWFTMCGFVRKVMGDDYIQKVKDKQNGLIDDVPKSPEDIFSHPHILAVLQHGYTREQIQSAFDLYGNEKLYNAPKLMAAIESLKHMSQSIQSSPQQGASNQKQAWSQSRTMEEGPVMEKTGEPKAMDEEPALDITPQCLVNKGKELYSPGSDEGIVIDDVEMEDMENMVGIFPFTKKHDQSPAVTKDISATSEESRHKNKSPGSPEKSNVAKQHITAKGKEDIDPVQLENEKLKEQKLCKICLDNELAITFLPCGHLATCEDCAKSLKECPICREPITQTVKTFWS